MRRISSLLLVMVLSTPVSATFAEGRWAAESQAETTYNGFVTSSGPQVVRTAAIDLDGNGSKENIKLTYYSSDFAILNIGKCQVIIELSGDGDPGDLDLNVIDINKKDKTKQLEIRELTTNIYSHRELVSYKNGEAVIIKMPKPANVKKIVSATYEGNGTIEHAYVNQMLYSWFYKETFKYDGKTVEHVMKSSYNLETMATANLVIKLQKSPTDKTVVFKTAKGMALTIVEANGKGWFKVKNSAGKMGWFFFDAKTNEIQGKSGKTVFDGLPELS